MQRVSLIFTWFYWNNGFAFFWLSYAVSESSFSVSVTKLHFGRSILPKNVLACWQLNQVTLSLKSVSAFLCLKYAVFSMIAGKTCFGLFAVKLGCFRRYCTRKCFLPVFSESHWFYLILLLTTFPSIFGWVTLSSVLCLEEQPSPFLYLNCAVNPLVLHHKKNSFCFLLRNALQSAL